MHFGENQLSRSLIGLSPLTTGHPPDFQLWWVRASTQSYPRFTLPMARSPRFGSRACHQRPLRTRFRYGYPTHGLTTRHTANSQAHSSKGTQSRHHTHKACSATLPRLVGTRFQVLFHSAPAVLFTIPSRYYPLSVTREYLGLPGGPGRFTQDSSGPVLLGTPSQRDTRISATGVLPSTPGHSHALRLYMCFLTRRPAGRPVQTAPTTPQRQPLPSITPPRFSLLRFRSPLLPESLL